MLDPVRKERLPVRLIDDLKPLNDSKILWSQFLAKIRTFQYVAPMDRFSGSSFTTKAIALLIIASASVNRQILDLFVNLLGRTEVSRLIWAGFAVTPIFFLLFLKRLKSSIAPAWAVLVLSAGILCAMTLSVPEERVHILKYGVLGFFLTRDYLNRADRHSVIMVLGEITLAGGVVASIDELFQWCLPYRVGDIFDVFLGACGSAWGGLFVLSSKFPTQNSNVKSGRNEQ